MSDRESESGGSGVLVLGCLVSLALAMGAAYYFHSSATPIEDVTEAWFKSPPLDLIKEDLQASRAKHFGEAPPASAAFDEYRTNYQAANLLMFAEPSPKEYERMNKLLEISATDALTALKDHKRFGIIGEPIFEACNQALDGLLVDLVEQRVSMKDAESGNLGDKYDVYKRNCGHVIPKLLEHNLITKNGEWRRPQYGPLLFDVLQRWRFSSQVGDRVHPSDGVSPADYRAMVEWRLMVPEAFSPAERYDRLADALKKPPEGLNLDRAEAFIAAAAADWNRARKAYDRVCSGPGATGQDKAACEWLKQFAPKKPQGPTSDSPHSKAQKGR